MITRLSTKSALHHVPDALSRMFEEDTNEDARAAGTVNLITAKDTVDAMNTEDDWYRKRYKEVISKPEKYTQWRVLDEQLYFLRPKPVVSESRRPRSLEVSVTEEIA